MMIFTGNGSADYIWTIGCDIWRYGDGAGWSSGVSYNNGTGIFNADPTDLGFHNLIIGNRISGGIDGSINDTDGNGIILDLYGAGTPVLITGNLVYMNGGRGIQIGAGQGVTTSAKVYVVNNTCWKNGLDYRKQGNWGEFVGSQAQGTVFANNLCVGDSSPTYRMLSSTGIVGVKNAGFGPVSSGFTPDFTADPQFTWTPPFTVGQIEQWKNPPKPWLLPTGAFSLSNTSPYVAAGVDPTTLAGLSPAMVTQMRRYAGSDLSSRERGSAPALGALTL